MTMIKPLATIGAAAALVGAIALAYAQTTTQETQPAGSGMQGGTMLPPATTPEAAKPADAGTMPGGAATASPGTSPATAAPTSEPSTMGRPADSSTSATGGAASDSSAGSMGDMREPKPDRN